MDEKLRQLERAAHDQAAIERLRKERQRRGETIKFGAFQSRSPAGYRLIEQLERALQDKALKALLLIGESGCGKSFVARAFHERRFGSDRPLVEVNLAASPEQEHDFRLFGLLRCAFTRVIDEAGALDLAEGGTLFLACFNYGSVTTQAKLWRFLKERRFRRVGSVENREAEVFVIGEGYPGYEEELIEGRLLEPFYAAIAQRLIHVPPLRERLEDLPQLFDETLDRFGQHLGLERSLSPKLREDALRTLSRYSWPGNIREFEHRIQQWLILGEDRLLIEDLAEILQLT